MVLNTGQIIAGRYEIIEKIGAGGTAIVYRAKDIKLDRFVTFKVLREEHLQNGDFKKRFNVEARAIASLNHPNIVNVYDVGSENDINYIVMEYINGVTLKELIVKRAPFDNDEVVGVTVQIAVALSHAHKNQVIHRDIKPQNILVTPNGTVKVADFGIARSANSGTTVSSKGSTMGSVHYISPEQANGEPTGAASDLYSLGILMYEMFTGELPFDGENSVSVALMHIHDPLPDIRQINPAVYKSIAGIIECLTEKDPEMRYQSADRLEADLKLSLAKPDKRLVVPQDTGHKRDLEFIFNKRQRLRGEVAFDEPDDEIDLNSFSIKDDEADKSLERKVVIAAVLSGLAIIALLTFFFLPFLKRQAGPELVKVPQFVGLSLSAAADLAIESGLKLNPELEDYNEEYAEGIVFLQDYEGGKSVQKETVINVAVSLGTAKMDVPDFTGKDMSTVSEMRSPFKIIELEYEYSDTVPINSVISQSPKAGEKLEAGAEILLTISKGIELKKVIVPDTLGLTETEARAKLSALGLPVGQISETYSTRYSKGLVVAQTPSGGKEALSGTPVILQISSGPPPETPKPLDPPVTTPEPTPQGMASFKITFNPYIDESVENIQFTVVKKTAEGMVEVYSQEHTSSDFPLDVTLTDTGVVEYHMLVNGIARGSKTIDFSSPTGEASAQ